VGTAVGGAASAVATPIYVQLDESTLRELARMTGGEYHHAGTAEKLRSVYENLGSRVQVRTSETELTALFAFGSALVAVAGSSVGGALVAKHHLSAAPSGSAIHRQRLRLLRARALRAQDARCPVGSADTGQSTPS
jgi:hypothetical protein